MAEIYNREDLERVCGTIDFRAYALSADEHELQNVTYIGVLKIFREAFAFINLKDLLK